MIPAPVKVSFLCISVEPGRDGVGDYVRQFAQALASRGHECQVIALADRHASAPSTMVDSTWRFEVVRIPADHWERGDIGPAEQHLARFAPDWVSLQMVCYGFERYGLLWRSPARFRRLRAASSRHMMFHELWIGDGDGSPMKDRAVGWMQKRLLLRATRVWSPAVVHTSNGLYRELLVREGIRAAELPIPGNIPFHSLGGLDARQLLLRRVGRDEPAERHEKGEGALLGGVFGTIHPEWGRPEWLERLEATCARLRRHLVLVQLGRPGEAGRKVLADLRRRFEARVTIAELGELSTRDISAALQGLDFGIATSPWTLLGKSGTVAAMLEHGLSVLVPRSEVRLRSGYVPQPLSHPLLLRTEDFCRRLAGGTLARRPPQAASGIYETFIASLASPGVAATR